MKISILLLLLILSGCSLTSQDIQLETSKIMYEATRALAPAAVPVPKAAVKYHEATLEQIEITSAPTNVSATVSRKVVKSADKIAVKPDAVLDQLSSASMMFTAPVNTNITQSIRAQLLIDPTISPKELEKSASAQSPAMSSRITISKIVIASIVADKFDIKALTPERQAMSSTSQTEWLWQLTPRSVGKHEITLSISAVVTVDGNTAERFIKTFEKTVIVEITTMQYIMGFAKQYWQWLWTVLIVPGIVWLTAKLKK